MLSHAKKCIEDAQLLHTVDFICEAANAQVEQSRPRKPSIPQMVLPTDLALNRLMKAGPKLVELQYVMDREAEGNIHAIGPSIILQGPLNNLFF